ncbi:hypothetical protein [Ligilactobacillus salivarius]|uniref:Uncharacterized protein n=1 Tax=Ligilactobacillus salivarius TaxID=1624 RepID=A0A1V9QMU9_9LACO|nr:hypothetical protein [Ligilactobacillus salivarius]OQQ79551.1 hypothetical protein B6U60_10330 [Ligilactobacillus salivarius]OQQ82051.1 hypothetical protein B6U59_10575 [Ligilactobacillus salivarius]
MSIREKYFIEIGNFHDLVRELADGRIYELTGVNGNSSASTLANKINKSFDEIINLIEKNEDGTWESIEKEDNQDNI